LHITPKATPEMFAEAKNIDEVLKSILLQLEQDETVSSRNAPVPQTISSRMSYIVYGTYASSEPPTITMKQQFAIVKEEIENIGAELKRLVDVDFRNLENKMEKAGAPYTPGRFPEFK
jgi:ribosomal protein S6